MRVGVGWSVLLEYDFAASPHSGGRLESTLMRILRTTLSLLLVSIWLVSAGCTPAQYARQADRDAGRMIRQGQKVAFGGTRPFDLAYEPIGAGGTASVAVNGKPIRLTGKPVELTLDDCLQLAMRSSRRYQTRKEELYRRALAVASARRGWNWALYGGELTGDADHERVGDGGEDTTSATAEVGPTLTQRFIHGGVLTLGATLDLATDFMGGSDTTIGSLLSANVSQPLLQGAWRGLAYEDQYRRERDLVFAVFDYQRFTQTFATDIVSEYYSVIRRQNEMINEETVIERLEQALKLTNVLVANGEATVVDQDQAVRRLLSARLRYQAARQDYRDALDRFKITLGLRTGARIELDYGNAMQELAAMEPKELPLSEQRAMQIALSTRPDVLVERAQVRDAERDVQIAADKFLPQLDLAMGIEAPGTEKREFWRTRFNEHTRSAKLTLQYDLDQTDNRDNYRLALIDWNKAQRELVEFHDRVRLDVRAEFRSLRRSRQSYAVQKERVRVARRSRKLALLKQREGQASTRDVLDAEEEYRSAQIGLTQEIVRYETTRLRFLATLGLLRVDEKGEIHEREDPVRFDRIAERYPYVGE
jgi:outer membrane protein TolC